MKNPNSPMNKLKSNLLSRWSAEDYPGAQPRFQLVLFGKDIAIFLLLPIFAIIVFKSCEGAGPTRKRPAPASTANRSYSGGDGGKSQIIDFKVKGQSGGYFGISKRSPGTVVKVRLLNVVETYASSPVHAQIVDAGLGNGLIGGTVIGDAVGDSNVERINITFHHVRDPNRSGFAIPIAARALSVDGTYGLIASKKEGFFARSALGSAQPGQLPGGDNSDFKQVLFRALTAGLMQEFGSAAQVERNRAHVLVLQPNTEFLVELTDYFPGTGK